MTIKYFIILAFLSGCKEGGSELANVKPVAGVKNKAGNVVRESSASNFGNPTLVARKGDDIIIIANSDEIRRKAFDVKSIKELVAAFKIAPDGIQQLAPTGMDYFTGSLIVHDGDKKIVRAITNGQIAPIEVNSKK